MIGEWRARSNSAAPTQSCPESDHSTTLHGGNNAGVSLPRQPTHKKGGPRSLAPGKGFGLWDCTPAIKQARCLFFFFFFFSFFFLTCLFPAPSTHSAESRHCGVLNLAALLRGPLLRFTLVEESSRACAESVSETRERERRRTRVRE